MKESSFNQVSHVRSARSPFALVFELVFAYLIMHYRAFEILFILLRNNADKGPGK